jgi:phage tail sheath gpL-like
LPQRLAVVGQGATSATYPLTKAALNSAAAVGALYGYGSPLHLVALQLFPVNGDGVGAVPVTFYPLDDAASGVASVNDVTPAGTATAAAVFYINVAGVRSAPISVAVGDVVADVIGAAVVAINSVLSMPVVAADATTKMTLTAKWKGASSAGFAVTFDGPTDAGVTFSTTQATAGSVNPEVDDALAQIGDVWETMVLNCLNLSDTTALETYRVYGEGRWAPLVRKPLAVLTGNPGATVSAATTITDARPLDRINCALPAPGSPNLPCVIAAAYAARILPLADSNPAHDYGGRQAPYIIAGADGAQWGYDERDTAVKAGSSTAEVRDGVVTLGDVVTMYHPAGDETPAYRYVVDIVKNQNVLYNVTLLLTSAEWDGAPLIPNDQPTTNASAKKPKMLVAAVAEIIDQLGLAAIISDPAAAKALVQAEIDGTNPKRINLRVPYQVSGNTNIKSADLLWSFYFGA